MSGSSIFCSFSGMIVFEDSILFGRRGGCTGRVRLREDIAAVRTFIYVSKTIEETVKLQCYNVNSVTYHLMARRTLDHVKCLQDTKEIVMM